MDQSVIVYDSTAKDAQSRVRGVGRYLQILKENFPDWSFTDNLSLITNNSVFINPFFNFLKKPLTMKRIAKKQIAVIHDLIPLKYPSHFPIGLKGNINVFLNKIVLRNYNVVVTDSEQSKKDIVTILKVQPERVKVIYPCLTKIYNSEFRVQNSERTKTILNPKFNSEFSIINSKFCLYVGDATWNKNLVNLARAIKLADVNCVFVGKVFEKNLESRIQNSESENKKILNSKFNSEFSIINSKFDNNPWLEEYNEFLKITHDNPLFHFVGYVPDDKLMLLYQKAACNLLVSRDEGFGFSYLEASSQNCPSILSNIPTLQEIAGDSALFIDPDSPAKIAKAIGQILVDQKLRIDLIEKTRLRSRFFSRKNFVDGFKSVLLCD